MVEALMVLASFTAGAGTAYLTLLSHLKHLKRDPKTGRFTK